MYTELGISALQQEQFALQEQAIIDRFFYFIYFCSLISCMNKYNTSSNHREVRTYARVASFIEGQAHVQA